jgi:flagella basal body P-ring formation protein FlgA
MRSCADRGLILLLLAFGAVPAGAAAVPPRLEARVAERVAAAWRVAPSAIRLEWPRATLPDSLPGDAPLRLVGEGREGWFVVLLGPAPGARALRVRAGLDDTVWVADRPLAGGSCLAAGDLRREPRLRWGAPAGPAGEGPGVGWEVRRPLAEGEIVGWPAVVPPMLVATGDPVRLIWCQGGVNLSLSGTALNPARRGEKVRARVEGRAETLAGTVIGRGTAVLGTGGDR